MLANAKVVKPGAQDRTPGMDSGLSVTCTVGAEARRVRDGAEEERSFRQAAADSWFRAMAAEHSSKSAAAAHSLA